MVETSTELDGGDNGVDLAYRWTVRTLYAVAIALNVWLLWDAVSDDTQTQIVIDKGRTIWGQITAPFHLDAQVKKDTGSVIYEAMQIVEDAKT